MKEEMRIREGKCRAPDIEQTVRDSSKKFENRYVGDERDCHLRYVSSKGCGFGSSRDKSDQINRM